MELRGTDSSIVGSSIHEIGCHGLQTSGGNPQRYEAGGLLVKDNVIERVAQWKRTYQAPISFSGCGNTYEGNRVGFVPHTCITGVGVNMSFSGASPARFARIII